METTKEATKTTLKPLGNRVLAKRLDQEEKLKGGIILPDSAKKKQETAVVVAVGPGALNKDGKVQPMPSKLEIKSSWTNTLAKKLRSMTRNSLL